MRKLETLGYAAWFTLPFLLRGELVLRAWRVQWRLLWEEGVLAWFMTICWLGPPFLLYLYGSCLPLLAILGGALFLLRAVRSAREQRPGERRGGMEDGRGKAGPDPETIGEHHLCM